MPLWVRELQDSETGSIPTSLIILYRAIKLGTRKSLQGMDYFSSKTYGIGID